MKRIDYNEIAKRHCDEAYREVTSVAVEFGKQTTRTYNQWSNTWFTYRTFEASFRDIITGNVDYSYKEVKFDVSKYEYSESTELAWEIESIWNSYVKVWRKLEWDDLDACITGCAAVLEYIAQRVADYQDAVEDWYSSDEYIDELREMNVA